MIDRSKLNNLQQHIVELDNQRTGIILGGPGTGKSLTMVLRAVHLVLSQRSVVILAPNAASKRRLEKLLQVTKYHQLISADILKKGTILTVSEYVDAIISRVQKANSPYLRRRIDWNEWYETQLVRIIDVLRVQGVLDTTYDVRQFHQLVMYLRSSDIDIQRAQVVQNIGSTNTAIYKAYEEFTERERVFHVDDSANYVSYIIRKNNDTQIEYPSYQHILVDDAQELTTVERNLIVRISQMTSPAAQLMLCVDDDQALLSYPRAAARYWVAKYEFDGSHPIREDDKTVLYSLTQSYRATELHQNTVQHMVRLNALRIKKHTNNSESQNFILRHVVEHKEHASVFDFQLLDEVRSWGKSYVNKEIAVIGRTSAQVRSFELTCLLKNVTMTYVGISPINRLPYISVLQHLFSLVVESREPLKNRRTLLDHILRVYLTPNDENALALTELKQIDDQLSLDELFAHTQTWWQGSEEIILFEKYVQILRYQLFSTMPGHEIIEYAYQFLRIDEYLHRTYGVASEYAEHVLIVQQFIEYWTFRNIPANQILENWRDVIPSVKREVSLMRIVLTTVEHVCGYEFDAVVIPRFMDGYMPAYGCSDAVGASNWELGSLHADVIQRERRWCYVAMTRAKSAFFWSTSPSVSGVHVSRFVSELGLVAPVVDASGVTQTFFTQRPPDVVQNELSAKLQDVIAQTQERQLIESVLLREHNDGEETRTPNEQLKPNENNDIQDAVTVNPNSQRFTEGSSDWYDVRKKLELSFAIVKRMIDVLSRIRNDRYEGFDRHVVQYFKRTDEDKVDNLIIAKKELFTTRIDYVDEQNPNHLETMYVGAIGIDECNIVSWTAPLAGDLLYKRNSPTYGMKARYLVQTKVNHDRLISMRLTYADSSALDESINTDWMTGDQYLRDILASTSRGEMRHIVQTIQYEQYQIIGAELAPFELVQGAPGTGKTSVALHRIAYIVANNKAISNDKVLLLGPNDVFFSHIKDVLPSLGVAHIKSQSVRNWLKDVGVQDTKGEDQLLSVPYAERSNYMRVQKNLVTLHGISQVEILVDMLWSDRVRNADIKSEEMSIINHKLNGIFEDISSYIDPATKNEDIKKRRSSAANRLKKLPETITISKDVLQEMYSKQYKRNVDGYKMLADYLIEAMPLSIENIWQGKYIVDDLSWLVTDQINKENLEHNKWQNVSRKSDIRTILAGSDWCKKFESDVKKISNWKKKDSNIIVAIYATSFDYSDANTWIIGQYDEHLEDGQKENIAEGVKQLVKTLDKADMQMIYQQVLNTINAAIDSNQTDKERNYASEFIAGVKEAVIDRWNGHQYRTQIETNVVHKHEAKMAHYAKLLSELTNIDRQNTSITNRITEGFKEYLHSFKLADDIGRMFSYLKTNLAHDSMYRVINHGISRVFSVEISKPASYEEDLLHHVITMYIKGYKSKINYQTRYVVIDEAQDLNPLIYWMLRKYIPNANIAAYGDMAQSIFQDVGENMWNEFAVASGFPSAKPLYLQTTYRSTKSIMALAKRALSKFPLPDYQYANAVIDSGIAPTVIQLSSHEKLMQYVLTLKESNPQFTYAIVFKKRESVVQFYGLCAKHNKKDSFLSVEDGQEDQRYSRITLTYTSKVKGLEFDIVIVADVDDIEYPADSYHARLLYVAISRAAKDLHIVYQNQLSTLLH